MKKFLKFLKVLRFIERADKVSVSSDEEKNL